jgi:hypothetical protein
MFGVGHPTDGPRLQLVETHSLEAPRSWIGVIIPALRHAIDWEGSDWLIDLGARVREIDQLDTHNTQR